MGIFFKSTCPACWEREENCKCSKKDIEKSEFRENNFVYKESKKTRFKGIELCENDIITTKDMKNMYVIKNFLEDGTPIVTLISNKDNDYFDKLWEFGEDLFVIKPSQII